MVKDIERQQDAKGIKRATNPFAKTHPGVDVDAAPTVPDAIPEEGVDSEPWATEDALSAPAPAPADAQEETVEEEVARVKREIAEDPEKFFAFAHGTEAAAAASEATESWLV